MRHWDTWEDGRVSKLFSIALDARAAAARRAGAAHGRARRRHPVEAARRPRGLRVQPGRRRSSCSRRACAGAIEPVSTNFDIWRVPADGSGAPVNLTPDNPAWDAQPAFSPDGRLLAHLAMERPGFEADRFRLVVRDAASGAIRFTTRRLGPLDRARSASPPDGREVYAIADDLGQRPLFAIDLGSGERRKLTGPGQCHRVRRRGHAHRLRAAEPVGARRPLPDRRPRAARAR